MEQNKRTLTLKHKTLLRQRCSLRVPFREANWVSLSTPQASPVNEETGSIRGAPEAAPSPFSEKAILGNLWENIRLIFFFLMLLHTS